MPVELTLKRRVGRPTTEEAKAHNELQDLLKQVETVPELVEIIQEGLVRRKQADEMDNAEGAQVNQVPDAAPPWMLALLNQIKVQGDAIASIQQELQGRKEAGGSGTTVKVKEEEPQTLQSLSRHLSLRPDLKRRRIKSDINAVMS